MPTIAEQFLKTEQAANALLDELGSLKEETHHYNTASMTLDAAGRSLSELASENTKLAEGIHEVAMALRDVGTPQLLDGLGSLTARCSEHTERLQEMSELLQQSLQSATRIESSLQAAVGALRSDWEKQATALEKRQQVIEGTVTDLTRSFRLVNWAVIAGFACSLATLLYLLLRG